MERAPGLRFLAGLVVTLLAGVAPSAAAQAPAKVDDVAAERGKVAFQRFCAACHGASADGKGVIAGELRTKVPDLRQLQKRNGGTYPFIEVVKAIDGRKTVRAHGAPDMPAWGDALQRTEGRGAATVEEAVSNLAHYLWTLQAK
jgi:mono/diheme cytochrome c family protein